MPTQLPTTRTPRSSGNIFLPHSHRPEAPQPQSGVGQDNPAPPPARTATPQPASLKKDMRSPLLDTRLARSQKHPDPKRKTVQLALWVQPGVKSELQRIAQIEGISLSATGAALLEQAIRQNIHGQYSALLQPMIEQTVRRELRSFGNRLVFFLMRIAYASEQSRILITNILDRILRREGVTTETFTNLVDKSNKLARRNIIHKSPQLQSLLEEWERSFQNEQK